MQMLRPLLLVALTVLTLPWGAWAGAHLPVRPLPADRAVLSAELSQQVQPQGRALTRASVPCRGPGLLGSSCAPDQRLPPAGTRLVPEPSASLRPLPRTAGASLWIPGGILDPPRPV